MGRIKSRTDQKQTANQNSLIGKKPLIVLHSHSRSQTKPLIQEKKTSQRKKRKEQ